MESDDQTFLCDIMFNIFDENQDQSKSELKVECFITKDEVIVIRNIQCFLNQSFCSKTLEVKRK